LDFEYFNITLSLLLLFLEIVGVYNLKDLIKKKLIEVRDDFESLGESKRNTMSLFKKHDLVLTGEKRNRIYAIELLYMIDVSVEKYLNTLPGICDELGLKYFNVITSDDLFKQEIEIRDFVIELI
jgi:hypothetical protein